MTRFARAKGSKSSNERVPESSTPWHVMKEDMQRVQQEKEDNKERQKIDKVRQENYNKFLKEQKSDVKNEWADFSDNESKSKKKDNKLVKGVEKPKSKKEKMVKISKDEIKEMLRPDPEIDSKVEKLTTKIDQILKKEDTNKKTLKKHSIKNNLTNGTQDERGKPDKSPKKQKKTKSENLQFNNDDAPMEVSAKIHVSKTPVTKKSKKKQTPLKIESVKKSENDSQNSPTKSEKEVKTNEPMENDSKSSENNDGEKPQNLTKSMKKRLMKKKKLAAQRLLNPKPETPEPKKKQPKPKKQKKRTPEGENANQDPEKNGNKNWKDNNIQFDDRKRKFGSEDNSYEKPNKFPRKPMKVAKVRDNLEHKRRKPDDFAHGPVKMNINGLEFEIVKFEGFPVKKEDADRLHQLRRQMISKGIPRSEVKRTLQLERRKAEKALAREKKKVCFQCRKAGHVLSECPDLNKEISSGTGICFKCGSTEHTHFECKVNKGEEFKFASCFICREQGHIARQCPDNPKGLYPQGGGCRICGDVTHLKKDCPQLQQENADNVTFLNTISSGNLEIDENETDKLQPKPMPVKNKVIKF